MDTPTGGKDRTVPFPASFKETLALHIDGQHAKHAAFLFESSWKKPYSTRGVRAMLARYAEQAGLAHNMPPHRLRHFLFTWLKTQGIDDALIQPYIQRPRIPHQPRDLQPPRHPRRPTPIRRRHRPLPRLTPDAGRDGCAPTSPLVTASLPPGLPTRP